MQSYAAMEQLYSWAKAILSSERGEREGEEEEVEEEEEREEVEEELEEEDITATMQSSTAMK